MLIFGHRPESTCPDAYGPLNPIYIEDIMPMSLESSDLNPIEIPGVKASQFRDYLLVLLGRPYDIEYSDLITSYDDSDKHSKDISMRYLDIAILSRRFGMIELENWAINALRTIFAGAATTLTGIASEEWDSETVLRLRAFTKATRADRPVLTFIQYIISSGSSEELIAALGDRIGDLPCVGLYHNFKASDAEPVLFGCAFLNILSMGHRSPVWTRCLTRNDRALFYAAQVQLADAPQALNLDLGWMLAPDLQLAASRRFCDQCEPNFLEKWNQSFGQFGKDLGSQYPLKDVLLLAQLPTHLLKSKESRLRVDSSTLHFIATSFHGCSRNLDNLLDSVDVHIQQVFIKAASWYNKIVEEL